ncbi:TetR/AcrR family transcriptional regulator [Nocardia sp. NPDC051570]|uniref:TetR/AcrR family transcriptional regulator n=1 Tax=Nocardia sp. NPDC051570 TaxID=3364324 RepID=UPI00379ED0EF
MVERIIDAGRRCLIEYGYEGVSTNRIAATAGISPGSLYQYFPNKDAIVSAVIDRFSDELASRIGARVFDQLDQPAPVIVRTTLAALLDELDVHPDFLRAVVERTPRLEAAGTLAAFERRIGELTTAYLMLHRKTLRPDVPLDTAAWILVRTVEHLTVRYVLDRPSIDRDQFLDEMSRLVLNYLRPVSNAN